MRKAILAALALCLLLPAAGWAQASRYPATGGGGSATFSINDYTDFDEMCGAATGTGQVGKLGWSIQNALGPSPVAEHPCLIGLAPGAGAGTVSYAYLGGFSASFVTILSSIRSVLFVAAFPTAANVPTAIVGMSMTVVTAVPADDAVYFEHLAADTNWFAVTRDGAAANYTRTDTGVAFSSGTYVRFRIDHPSSGVWTFYMNDVLVATHQGAMNIPAEAQGVWYLVQHVSGGTAATALFDAFAVRYVTTR